MEMILHSHANKTHFHKKGCSLSLILKVRVSETRKWPIAASMKTGCRKLRSIYAQLVQRRLSEESVLYIFFSENSAFSILSSTFMRRVFTPIEFNISHVKYAFTTLTSLA